MEPDIKNYQFCTKTCLCIIVQNGEFLKTGLERYHGPIYKGGMALPKTENTLDQLEEQIARNHGDLARACRALGIRLHELTIWMQNDPEVAATIKAAQLVGWAGIESAAIQRAVDGYQEDVYYQGTVVGQQTKYSDALMNTILKARVPGYNPEIQHAHMHQHNVQIMPRASTYEEWEQMRDHTLQPKDMIVDVVPTERSLPCPTESQPLPVSPSVLECPPYQTPTAQLTPTPTPSTPIQMPECRAGEASTIRTQVNEVNMPTTPLRDIAEWATGDSGQMTPTMNSLRDVL